MCMRNPSSLALYATKELLCEAGGILVPAGNIGVKVIISPNPWNKIPKKARPWVHTQRLLAHLQALSMCWTLSWALNWYSQRTASFLREYPGVEEDKKLVHVGLWNLRQGAETFNWAC